MNGKTQVGCITNYKLYRDVYSNDSELADEKDFPEISVSSLFNFC